MTQQQHRLKPLAVVTIVAVFMLAACQDRKPTETQAPSASSGEYPTSSDASPTSSSTPVVVPGKGADVTAKGADTGMVGGASVPWARRYAGIRFHERSWHRRRRVERQQGRRQEIGERRRMATAEHVTTGVSLTRAGGDQLVISCEHADASAARVCSALLWTRDAARQPPRLGPGCARSRPPDGRCVPRAAARRHHDATAGRPEPLDRSSQLFSEVTRALPPARRQDIVDIHYRPHRQAIEAEIARLVASGHRVMHVAPHSFTPTLDDVPRQADVAWLYDPRRPGEVAFARSWMRKLAQLAPDLRLRRNYPYRGRGDGLTAALRRRHPDAAYVGIELEVNQSLVEQPGRWDRLQAALIASLKKTLAGASDR